MFSRWAIYKFFKSNLVAKGLRMYIQKNKPKIITYGNYKKFDSRLFHKYLESKFSVLRSSAQNVNIFQHIFTDVLNKYERVMLDQNKPKLRSTNKIMLL